MSFLFGQQKFHYYIPCDIISFVRFFYSFLPPNPFFRYRAIIVFTCHPFTFSQPFTIGHYRWLYIPQSIFDQTMTAISTLAYQNRLPLGPKLIDLLSLNVLSFVDPVVGFFLMENHKKKFWIHFHVLYCCSFFLFRPNSCSKLTKRYQVFFRRKKCDQREK